MKSFASQELAKVLQTKNQGYRTAAAVLGLSAKTVFKLLKGAPGNKLQDLRLSTAMRVEKYYGIPLRWWTIKA